MREEDAYKPVGDRMGVWNHPMHDLQTRLEICAGAVEHQAAIAANMRRQRNDLRALLGYWTHESHLQTFEDRERFRKAARELLYNPLGAHGATDREAALRIAGATGPLGEAKAEADFNAALDVLREHGIAAGVKGPDHG